MQVKILHYTPLYIADKAISKCWDKEKEDCDYDRIYRVGNKFKHSSTLEHVVYTMDINGISRACLQELARHRMASLSVKSTRYTLKELKKEEPFVENGVYYYNRASKYVVLTNNITVDKGILDALENISSVIGNGGISNDIVKYMLPEAYKTSLVLSINMRSLQNFLKLRANKAALWEIRALAQEIYFQLPESHKYMMKEFVEEEK